MVWWSRLDDEVYIDLEDLKLPSLAAIEHPNASWPQALQEHITGPTAVLARHIATPNYEMLWFARLARRHGFHALVIEHSSDMFTVNNSAKHALARLPIVVGRSRGGQPIIRRQKIVDPNAAEGRPLNELTAYSGECLVAYHHRKLTEVFGADTPQILDLRDVLTCGPGRPSDYYVEFFKMLSGGLVLFEDFVIDDRTAAFFQATIRPAWQRAVAETRRRPQITRLVPDRRASSPIWNAYPPRVADEPSWIMGSLVRDETKPSASSQGAASRGRPDDML